MAATGMDAPLSQVMALLQQGRTAAARDAIAALPPGRRDAPDALHLAGLVELAEDRTGAALPLLERAAAALPDDPVVQLNWTVGLLRADDLARALPAAERAVSLAPRHSDAHFHRGLILARLHRHDDAAAAFRRTLELAPRHARAWRQLGLAEHARGRYLQAEVAFRRALDLTPDDAYVHAELAAVCYDAGSYEDALRHADRALDALPSLPAAWRTRSSALRRLGRLDEAMQAAERAVALGPDDPDAIKLRGLVHQMRDALPQAAADFSAAAALRFAPGADVPLAVRELRRTSRSKLRHDIEQFRHLAATGALRDADDLAARHERALAALDVDSDTRVVDLTPPLLQPLGGTYNRLHHVADAPRLQGPAINPALDGAAIERAYAERAPGIAWIDGLLTDEALASLRRYCLSSTFWFDFHHANGYLGAFFEDGFAAPLLLQIADELRLRFPSIFRDHPLTQLWAFKYDSRLDGIELHADIAEVNLNFWITPDEANLDPDSGGLVVFDREAPPQWGFDEFNTSTAQGQARIRDFLERSGAQAVRVPYRQNRAVLFNSDLFHRTDTIRFRDGYENRRINVTMLFGRREGRLG